MSGGYEVGPPGLVCQRQHEQMQGLKSHAWPSGVRGAYADAFWMASQACTWVSNALDTVEGGMSVTIVRRINHRLGVGLSSRRRCDEDLCGLSLERLQDGQKYGGTLNWKDRKQHGAEPRQPKVVMGVGCFRRENPALWPSCRLET